MTTNRRPTEAEIASKPNPPPEPPRAGMYLPKRTVDDIAAEQAALHKAKYDLGHITPKNTLSLEVRNKDNRKRVAFLLGKLSDLFDRSARFKMPDDDLKEMQQAEVDALGRKLLGSWDREVKT